MPCILLHFSKKYLMIVFCLLISLSASACTGAPVNLKGDLTYPITVQVDELVKRNPPVIYVHPNNSPDTLPRVLFVPFKVTQDMEYRVSLSKNVSRQFWNTWLSQQSFEVLEFYDSGYSYTPERALAHGRRKGADLVVGGYITHYLDGGVSGDSYASISVEVYEVATGALLWSMAQAGAMEKQAANDFFIFKIEKRLPADPISYIVTVLASDMGEKIHAWTKPDELADDTIFDGQVF